MNLKDLVGKRVDFHGVDNKVFAVATRKGAPLVAFEVLEDEDDGYRSMMKDVKTVPAEAMAGFIFFPTAVARVTVEDDPYIDGYRLVDANTGHVWLRFGTDYADSYYPMFVFEYAPSGERVPT